MTNSKELLILVDGSSYLYRAFHALPPLVSSKGQPTGAIRGVVSMIKKLLLQYPTNNIGVIFDAKGKTFRHDMYPEYKANRPPMPDDLRAQIEPLHELIKAQGWPLIAVPNVEADDVIGTYAKIASEAGQKVLVSTGDKDMAQLVNDDVHLINTMNNYYFDYEGVVEKFGVAPEQIIDYLALMGDTSDNIPGIPKVGPKTAVKWLAKYKSLDNIVENADEFGGKIGEYLRASLEQLPLSKKLTTIDCDLKLDTPVEALTLAQPDIASLQLMYQDLEFKSWIRELDKAESKPTAAAPDTAEEEPKPREITADYQTVSSQTDFDALLNLLDSADIVAFDTETTSLDELDAEIVGLSFAVKADQAYYIPVAHDYLDAPDQLDRTEVLTSLKPWLENTAKHKVGQNLKYDYKVLLNYDIQLKGISDDTMLASYVSNPTAGRHDMDTLASRCLDRTTIHYEELTGKGKSQINFSQVAIEDATPYAAEDADITLQLHQHFQPELTKVEKLNSVYKDIEVPLLTVLAKIETQGVHIDTSLLATQSQEITTRVAELEKEAFEIAGEPFNLNSPKQLQKIFFEDLKIPVIRKTSKGQPSTAVDVLEELAVDYPLPKLILEHRSMVKLKNTYIDKLPQQINAKTGRVHTSYHQAVASTGRLSSVNPNLQNIPIKSAEGRRIRQAFTAPKDHKIVAIDYSQIELRIMAHLSNDDGLISAFNEGLDIHTATAAEVFGIDTDSVESEQRRAAKAINFGLIYGMSAFGLAKQLNVGRRDAQTYIDLYFSRYPGVLDYMETTKEKAKDTGYVETLLGRRLYLPDINARNGQTRAYAERTAINAPMQGTAADIIKLAMLAVDKHLMEHSEQGKMIMQVHDELVFEIPEKGLSKTSELIKKEMESVITLTVPLIAEVGVGDNWDEAH